MSSQSEQRPEYRGQCAFALSIGKKGVAGKDNCYMIQDGRKYLFSNSVARFLWRVLPGRRDNAERNWSDR